MQVNDSGIKVYLVVEYTELLMGVFPSVKSEDMIVDASQVSYDNGFLVVRRKGRGRGTAEHFTPSMVRELRVL